MYAAAQHLGFAKQHFDEAASMHKTMRLRWAAVAYFYAANHMIKSALPTLINLPLDKQHPTFHTGPNGTTTIVKRFLPALADAYESLFVASVGVRYNGRDVLPVEADNLRHTDLPTIAPWTCLQLHGSPCDCWLNSL